jgi:DNA invertase Pin-like site-specific DNA recombinase
LAAIIIPGQSGTYRYLQGRVTGLLADSGQSEADQLPDINLYCDDRSYAKGRTYEVHGKSAFKGAQDPDWQKVVKDIQDGQIDVVVCWMVDRLDRKNILHAIPMALKVLDAGGRIEFSEQPECNLDAKSETIDDEVKAFSDRIHAANQESKIKSKRVLKAHKKRRANGSAIGRAPWGYAIICTVCEATPVKPRCNNHKKLFVPTAIGRKYIPVIFAKVIEGESLRDIAAWLTAEKVPTTTGGIWNEGYLGTRLIKNPVYYGARRNGGQLETEALISASTFQQANAALKSRIRPGRDASVRDKALLAPVCGECKGVIRDGCLDGISPMYRVYGGYGEARKPYYRCTGHGPQRKGCGFMIPVSELDEWVIDGILDNHDWHTDRVFIAGDDQSDKIAKLRERGADLFRQGDYAGAAECGRQATELETAPRVKPHWDTVITDQSEADYFAAMDLSQRREYLASLRVVAYRDEVRVESPKWDETAA